MQADAAGALQQLQEAAAHGDPYATFNLGYMHMKGMGTPPNATAAQVNFEQAARHDIPSAYNGLGVLHYEGQAGAAVDYVAARQAFEAGAQLGDPDAMFNLATMYAGMRLNLGLSVTSPMLTAHLVSAMLSCHECGCLSLQILGVQAVMDDRRLRHTGLHTLAKHLGSLQAACHMRHPCCSYRRTCALYTVIELLPMFT